MTKTLPFHRNACAGHYDDWLEVYLTQKCNATCKWCVDKHGWKPDRTATWQEIADVAIATNKKNIILLGGEPTLYPDLQVLIGYLATSDCRVWITTNGSRLSHVFVDQNLRNIHGVNISVHHYWLRANHKITSLNINQFAIRGAISSLTKQGATVRMNCNCIHGAIDSESEIAKYVAWAKEIGAGSVRFAELKHDDDNFVNLATLLDGKYGLSNDPFANGCSVNAEIDGMPVNFRLMCGFQTPLRPRPDNPVFAELNPVLYYNAKLYPGWQTKENTMDNDKLTAILEALRQGVITADEAKEKIVATAGPATTLTEVAKAITGGGYCQY